MPDLGEYPYNEPAAGEIDGDTPENKWHTLEFDYDLSGTNHVITVEVHEFEISEADISFDLSLVGSPPE